MRTLAVAVVLSSSLCFALHPGDELYVVGKDVPLLKTANVKARRSPGCSTGSR